MATMKTWHIIVLDGWKTVEEKSTFSVGDSRTMFDELKTKYDEINTQSAVDARANGTKAVVYSVKREYY